MMQQTAAALNAPARWMRSLYDWTLHWSQGKHAYWALFIIAFMESSFFPIPPDVLLIAMVVARRDRWVRTALVCTAGSVLGSLLGYVIGWGFYETIGRPIADLYNLHHAIDVVGQKFSENAFLTIFTAAFTPIPYKAITIASGLFKISVPTLIVASIIGRAGRFFIVAGALRIFGDPIKNTIEKYFNILSFAFVALLVGGFVVLKYFLK